eukprot:10715033-Alexandrium_andersonii.AAC.1
MAAKSQCELLLSPVTGEGTARCSAGVGVFARQRTHVAEVKLNTKACQQYRNAGRLSIYLADIGAQFPV